MNKQPERLIRNDLTGQKFSKLTVIEQAGKDERGSKLWKCKCECGTEKIIKGTNLKSGNTKSCGCFRRNIKKKHGMRNTRVYSCYIRMKTRCNNPNCQEYQWYGARGIKVCEEWASSPMAFIEWALNNGYDDNLTLDRINPDRNYSPDNCRWATQRQQNQNKPTTIWITKDGETKTLSEWSSVLGISRSTAWSRYRERGTVFKEDIV